MGDVPGRPIYRFSEEDFEALCRAGTVREAMAIHEQQRRAELIRFFSILLGGIALAAMVGIEFRAEAGIGIWVIAYLIFITVIALAIFQLQDVAPHLKHPVMEYLAAKLGMEYRPDGFEPPVYGEARRALLGILLSEHHFTDLLWGEDEAGCRIAIYDARVIRRFGRSASTAFRGQMYAFQRRPGSGSGLTIVVPEPRALNIFRSGPDVQRVDFSAHPEFARRLKIYSSDPLQALLLFQDASFRHRLLEWRGRGRIAAYATGSDAVVAFPGRDRFEPGSFFRSRSAEARVRRIFDEVAESIDILQTLRTRWG